MAGAFDNLSFDAINESISGYGFDSNVTGWINNMLRNRIIIYEINGIKMKVKATRGTPQEGVLSPTLWILVMNSLLKELKSKKFEAVGYADDLTLICRGKHLNELSDRTQHAIKIVEKWCKKVGLTVNAGKSELVIFTKNRILSGYYPPKIFNKEIRKTDSAKYLGVILDSKLNWNKHIESS